MQDTFRQCMKELHEQGDLVAGMERKCLGCGEYIPLYTEQNDNEHGGRPYYVDAIDHDCNEELDLTMPPLSSERVTMNVVDRGRGESHLTLED